MTNHHDPAERVAVSPLLLLEAFIDGERVEAEALKAALADADARAHLVDMLVLRQAVAASVPLMPTLSTSVRGTRNRLRWIAAAAAMIVSLATGYALGKLTFVPAIEASGVETFVQVDATPPPPVPTRVIRLTPGVEWTDHAGGR